MGISVTQVEIAADCFGSDAAQLALSRRRPWLRAAGLVCFLTTRLAFGGFFLVTSVYCLLVYVPFTYFGFIHNALLGWLPGFVRWHAVIYAGVLCAVTATLVQDFRQARTRRAVAVFVALNFAICLYLWYRPALADVTPDLASYFWSLASLLPLILLAAIDLSGSAAEIAGTRPEPAGLELAATTTAALVISIAFAAEASVTAVLHKNALPALTTLQGFGASVCFHLVIFTVIGLSLQFLKATTRKASSPRRAYFVGACIFAWLLCLLGLRTIVLPTISFEGPGANVFAAVVAFALVFYVVAFSRRLRAAGADWHPSWSAPWLWILLMLALFITAYAIPALIGLTDWDFVLQRIAVIALWILALRIISWSGFAMGGKAVPVAVLVVVCGSAGFARYAQLTLYNPDPQPTLTDALDAYAGADISFKTSYSILSHSVNNNAYSQFYDFLKRNTNLGRNVSIAPADVSLVADLRPSAGPKPNIFLFVIDSLRRDYTSPYNSAVDYTPEIGRFAQDSVVLENAFTRYGGTALSEPAIWVGAMQLHKQYIEPFYPMNNLQKLVETDGYHSYISLDPILRAILRPSSSITELEDDKTSWGELDFVPTLKKLETKIAERRDPGRPIFAYSQPQNVHTLTLERSRMKGGRKEISIYELRRMDAAFGEFVRFLRRSGLYDNSIIILTADHGDSYGEFGRYGHSVYLFPEVIRIPLIIHLPPQLRQKLVWNTQQAAFTTDITPSLYYLLGHRPILNNELFGRPIFTQTEQEQSEYLRSSYLLVSSYAPTYAVLGNNGKSLFIVDAVNRKNYFYDLAQDPLGTRNHVTIPLRNENEALIRGEVRRIDDFYGWRP
ncbi:MAG: sulfatase-like hydrolase/transferase [Terriglobales bacterium]